MTKTNITIFGKNGQISSNLITLFKTEKNFNITAYSSKEVDFSNLEELKNFFTNQTTYPDFIINASAYTDVDKAEEKKELSDFINHQAVAIIANHCHKNNIKLIHYSTDYVFDGSGTKPFTADNTKNLNPLNHYGKTKLAAEQAIIKSNCQYLILRISWVYDPNPTHKNFLNTITKLAQAKETRSIINDQIGSPTSAIFIAQNTIQIIKNSLNKNTFPNTIRHLNNSKFISWYDFALKIISDLKKQGKILKVKTIHPIKTSQYPTKAARPLNSRLG